MIRQNAKQHQQTNKSSHPSLNLISRSTYPDQSVLHQINCLKNKAYEQRKCRKNKDSCFSKLAHKIQSQLRELKNHHTSEARQKLLLLEKCKNQIHIRDSSKNHNHLESRLTHKKIHSRPQSCFVSSNSSFHHGKPKYFQDLNDKIERVKQQCNFEQNKSVVLKSDIESAFYYTGLIQRNSNRIFRKIL